MILRVDRGVQVVQGHVVENAVSQVDGPQRQQQSQQAQYRTHEEAGCLCKHGPNQESRHGNQCGGQDSLQQIQNQQDFTLVLYLPPNHIAVLVRQRPQNPAIEYRHPGKPCLPDASACGDGIQGKGGQDVHGDAEQAGRNTGNQCQQHSEALLRIKIVHGITSLLDEFMGNKGRHTGRPLPFLSSDGQASYFISLHTSSE